MPVSNRLRNALRLGAAAPGHNRLRNALFLGTVTIVLVFLMWSGQFFIQARLRFNDLYIVGYDRSDNIVIVAVDDASLATYGRSLLDWDRSVYADLVSTVNTSGARVIAFDILFLEPSDQDMVFAEALRAARTSDTRSRIVIPATGSGTMSTGCAVGNINAIGFPSVLRPISSIQDEADYIAYVNSVIDVDGYSRRQPSFICTPGTTELSLSLATYLAYLRIPALAASQVIKPSIDGTGFAIEGGLSLPTDTYGLWRQDFFGAPQETFPVYSLVEVLSGDLDPSVFADKIVLVGLIDSQGATDSYPVPISTTGQPMAGVEIIANAIETLIRNQVPFEQPQTSIMVMIIGLSLSASLLMIYVRWFLKLALAALFGTALFMFASVNFAVRHELIDLFIGLLTVAITTASLVTFELYSERRERLRTINILNTVEGQRRLVDAIFMNSPLPMALLNENLDILRANSAFEADFTSHETAFLPRLVTAGLTETTAQQIQTTLRDPDLGDAKLKFTSKTMLLRSSMISQTELRVVTLSEVTTIEQLSDLKTRLIRIAAHDIRNPLSSVIGFVDVLMLDKKNLTPRQTDLLQRVKGAGESINQILSGILKLEQLRSASLPLERLNPNTLIEGIADRHDSDMVRREHTFIRTIAPDLPDINAEPTQLGQAISNLLSNAAKYTPNGGRIELRVLLTDQKRLRIEIQDNGYGIPESAQEQLFTEFYRVTSKMLGDISGTGLGLSLVKSIIIAHSGRVWVHSVEDEGSTFFIELPTLIDEVQ